MPTQRALLLIADIGGYTDYMQYHRSVLGHAEAATARMLGKVVDAARGFDLVEIEGDAAFLSRDASGLDGPGALEVVTRTSVALHRVFHRERRFVELNMCPCGSCTRTSGLTLKFVAHVGEVATQTIRRRTKLVGTDVIHVHRLLKNPVDLPEYLLVSDELYRAGVNGSDGSEGSAGSGAAAMRTIELDLEELDLAPNAPFSVTDELTGASWIWYGPTQYVLLDPAVQPGHVLHLAPLTAPGA